MQRMKPKEAPQLRVAEEAQQGSQSLKAETTDSAPGAGAGGAAVSRGSGAWAGGLGGGGGGGVRQTQAEEDAAARIREEHWVLPPQPSASLASAQSLTW